MTTLREAALIALKALEFGHLPVADQAKHRDVMSYIEAMDVLRKALDADSMASLPEPVAWRYEISTTTTDHGYDGWEHRITKYKPTVPEGSIRSLTPLYTAPPKRKWQSLTDEEIKDIWCWDEYLHSYQKQMIEDIQAKLKEKNT